MLRIAVVAISMSIGSLLIDSSNASISTHASTVITSHKAVAPSVVFAACGNACNEPACLSLGAHKNETGTNNWGPDHACQLYDTVCPHPGCGELEEECGPGCLADAVAATDPSNVAGLAEFLTNPKVHLNQERSAIQFTDCQGAVVAQVEFDQQTMLRLVETLNN